MVGLRAQHVGCRTLFLLNWVQTTYDGEFMKNKQKKLEPSKTYNELLEARREIVALKTGRRYQKRVVVNPNPNPCTNVMMNIAYELTQKNETSNVVEQPKQDVQENSLPIDAIIQPVNALRFLSKEEVSAATKEEVIKEKRKYRKRSHE